MALTIPGFEYERLNVDDPVELNVAIGGSGRPVVLLHGFPQTHLMWRHVAIELASNHTVICPDLRGYGESDKPPATNPTIYSKRTMAADVIALARRLGHDQLALVGHDRGALVAIRAGLEHPETITHLASLDVLPTLEMWDILHGASATVAFHMYLMAQPPGLPETMISASADTFFGHFLDAWSQSPRRDPTGGPQPLPDRVGQRGALHRRRLPRLRRNRSRARHRRPFCRTTTHDARHRHPARLGSRIGIRRARHLALLGTQPRTPHHPRRTLHGRGSSPRNHHSHPRAARSLSRRQADSGPNGSSAPLGRPPTGTRTMGVPAVNLRTWLPGHLENDSSVTAAK